MSNLTMKTMWSSSRDFWQKEWAWVYDLFGRDEFNIAVFGTFIYVLTVFWVTNIIFIFLDLTGKPEFLLKYKIQPTKNRPLQMADFMRAVKVALINQFIIGLPFIVCVYYSMKWRGCSWLPEDLPSAPRLLLDLIVFTAVEEVGFYYSHRLFHHPRLYKHYHKIHHEWTAPIGVTAIYAHPLEHICANMFPLAAGPVLMGSHQATIWLFWGIALYTTVVNHSGYHLPLLSSPEAHDFHHLKFNCNYGVLGVLDYLHGTDTMFRESVAFKRHYKLLSTVPVSQQVPEPNKKQL